MGFLWLVGGVGGCVGQFPAKRVFMYATESEIDGAGARFSVGDGTIGKSILKYSYCYWV